MRQSPGPLVPQDRPARRPRTHRAPTCGRNSRMRRRENAVERKMAAKRVGSKPAPPADRGRPARPVHDEPAQRRDRRHAEHDALPRQVVTDEVRDRGAEHQRADEKAHRLSRDLDRTSLTRSSFPPDRCRRGKSRSRNAAAAAARGARPRNRSLHCRRHPSSADARKIVRGENRSTSAKKEKTSVPAMKPSWTAVVISPIASTAKPARRCRSGDYRIAREPERRTGKLRGHDCGQDPPRDRLHDGRAYSQALCSASDCALLINPSGLALRLHTEVLVPA